MAASFIKRRRREEAARKAAEIAKVAEEELERRESEMVAPWINKTQPKKVVAPTPVVPIVAPVAAVETKEPEEVIEPTQEVVPLEAKEPDIPESINLGTLRKSELVTMASEQGLNTKGLTKTQLIKLLEA